MVAKITFPHSTQRVLNYNEKKVEQGVAECIYAGNYLREAGDMNFYQKLEGLENYNSLNERATTKTLHLTLNFDPTEAFSKERLIAIATTYMEKTGFGEQPFLVYQHFDAGHPHMHIVSTTIRADGSRMNTHNIGKGKSEKARKEIEQEFNLVRAQGQKLSEKKFLKPLEVQKLQYGKGETKRGITSVLDAVIDSYRYTSLAELNAVLKQFNVGADRGREDGRIYQSKGLVYRLLDAQGNKIGVPIKASSIYSKPTLKYLEERFALNGLERIPYKARVREAIDDILNNRPGTMKEFMALLEAKGINTVLRQNGQGFVYGITLVDNTTKCVFDGSDLGKGYSAAAIQSRFTLQESPSENATALNPQQEASMTLEKNQLNEIKYPASLKVENSNQKQVQQISVDASLTKDNMLHKIMEPKPQAASLSFELLKKKKRKKRNLHL